MSGLVFPRLFHVSVVYTEHPLHEPLFGVVVLVLINH